MFHCSSYFFFWTHQLIEVLNLKRQIGESGGIIHVICGGQSLSFPFSILAHYTCCRKP